MIIWYVILLSLIYYIETGTQKRPLAAPLAWWMDDHSYLIFLFPGCPRGSARKVGLSILHLLKSEARIQIFLSTRNLIRNLPIVEIIKTCLANPLVTFQFPPILMWAWPHVPLLMTKVSSLIIPISLISITTRSGMYLLHLVHHISIKHIGQHGWSSYRRRKCSEPPRRCIPCRPKCIYF
jgi:hypothetical protein